MSKDHSSYVKNNFETQAREYDQYMLKVVPDYLEMLQCITDYIPFDSDRPIRICDLGCGTGNVTERLVEKYPEADLTCVDLSPAMMDMAKAKIKDKQIQWIQADFYDYRFDGEFDLITSSLALHHLVTDEDKKMFYRKIHGALKPGGVFINADVMDGVNPFIEQVTMDNWREWMRQYHDDDKVENTIKRYYEEDRPTTIINHIHWMEEIGFQDVDILWKKIKGVIYTGAKPGK